MANQRIFSSGCGDGPVTDEKNEAGGRAYLLPPKQALAQLAATGTFNQTYYSTAERQVEQMLELLKEVDAEYIAKVAVYSRRQAYMKDMPAFAEAPEFEVAAMDAPEFETPAWVKEPDAQREADMKDMPAFGEAPEFEVPAMDATEFAEAPEFETPAWVKELDAQRDAGIDEMPAFGEAPEFDTPDLKEMEERRAEFIKESDERRAARDKAFEERRAASKKRHEEFMKKFNKVSNEEAVEEAAVEKQG